MHAETSVHRSRPDAFQVHPVGNTDVPAWTCIDSEVCLMCFAWRVYTTARACFVSIRQLCPDIVQTKSVEKFLIDCALLFRGCVDTNTHTHTHTHIYTYSHTTLLNQTRHGCCTHGPDGSRAAVEQVFSSLGISVCKLVYAHHNYISTPACHLQLSLGCNLDAKLHEVISA